MRVDVRATGVRVGETPRHGQVTPAEGLGGDELSPRPMRLVQRARLWAMTPKANQAALASKRPEGMW